MRAMMREAGPLLHTLPTGETRRHRTYIEPIIDDLVAQHVLEVRRLRADRTVHRLRKGSERNSEPVTLGYARETSEALPIIARLRDFAGPTLQIGMPTPLTLAFVALGVRGAITRPPVFADATAAELAGVRAVAGDDVVVQLEAPAELVLTARTRPLHRTVDAAIGLSRGIGALAARAPEGTRFGVHLCLGGKRNKARAVLRDVRPLVDLANAVVRHWPAGRTLEYLHAPLSAGEILPSDRPDFYAPLVDLVLGGADRVSRGLRARGAVAGSAGPDAAPDRDRAGSPGRRRRDGLRPGSVRPFDGRDAHRALGRPRRDGVRIRVCGRYRR